MAGSDDLVRRFLLGETRSVSEIHYTRTSGAAIAYRVVGDGPVDLVFVPDYESNLVYGWEWPRWRVFYERLGTFTRLILFDKRGTGLSDHRGGFPTLETRMEDLRAVLDAVGSDRCVVLGGHEGCAMACLFAATYPERTAALVLFQPAVTAGPVPYGEPRDPDGFARLAAEVRDRWGEQDFCNELLSREAPSLAADPTEREWFANWCRVSATPSMAYALMRAFYETDLTDVLPVIRVPTLVLHRGRSSGGHAHAVAERVRDARLVQLPGDDVWGIFLSPQIPDEIERFVAGHSAAEETDRVLTTMLFTDLVGSSARAAALGDAEWKRLLERHHSTVRQELARFRGREVDTAGDGFFATFDGPARAIRCAAAIRGALSELELDVRAGVHTGECEVLDDKPAGTAVHAGSRICAAATAGQILVSNTVKDLVAGSGIAFDDRGVHQLHGIPDSWQLYAVVDP